MLIITIRLAPKEDKNTDEEAAGKIGDKVPAGVEIPPNICFRKADDRDELNNLIKGSKAHAGEDA